MVTERTYNVPLRKGFINKAKYKKTKKAVSVLKEFLMQHMKSDKILIGKNLNQYLWKDGIKNPPHHVKITAIKGDDGTVRAELLGFKYDHKTKEEKDQHAKKEEKKVVADKKPAKHEKKSEDGVEAVTKESEDVSSEKSEEKKPVKPKKVKKE